MIIIDLIGWITFALLLIGAGWAAWRVYRDVGNRRGNGEAHEVLDSARESDTSNV